MIKLNFTDLYGWRSTIINSNTRYWDSYNISEITSKSPVVDIRFIANRLDSALNMLYNIFTRGGRSWFYNIFYRPKLYVLNLKTMLYVPSIKPHKLLYGLTFPSWFPGRLSNHKFIKIRTKIMKKKLFFHKFSALRKSFRFYRAGGFRGYIKRRRRRYKIPYWAKLNRFWRPRPRSRRKGFSYRRLALHFRTFMNFKKFKPRFKNRYKIKNRYKLKNKYKFKNKYKEVIKPKLYNFQTKYVKPDYRNNFTNNYRSQLKTNKTKTKKNFKRKFLISKAKKLNKLIFRRRIKKVKKRKIKRFTKKKLKRRAKKLKSKTITSWVYFSKKVGSFFYKPDLIRGFKLYNRFKPVKYAKIELDTLKPGTPENPTDLPLTNMPTTSIRRRAKKKKKIFKLNFKPFNNVQGQDFNFLISEFKTQMPIRNKRILNFKKALFYPSSRFYKLLLLKPYRLQFKQLLKRYKESRISFDRRFRPGKLRRAFRRVKIKNYKKRYQLQSKLLTWFNKVLVLSAKLSRLQQSQAIKFRTFLAPLVNISNLPFKRGLRFKYKKLLSKAFKFNKYILNNKKALYDIKFRRYLKRSKKIRRFKLSRTKAKIGKITDSEKVFKRDRKGFRILNNLKRKTLIKFLLSGKVKTKVNKDFTFNFSTLKPIRQKRLVQHKYIGLKRYYKYKRSPLKSKVKVLKVLPDTTHTKFTALNKSTKFKQQLIKSKKFKSALTTKLPRFLRDKFFKRLLDKTRNFYKLKKFKLNAKPHIFYPTIIMVSRLSRLTSSVLNEARVVGVISIYLSDGEASPFASLYTIIMNDNIRQLSKIEPIVKDLALTSKMFVLLGKCRVV